MYRKMYDNSAECTKQIKLTNTFRKLWEEHVMWTRLFIISTVANLGDLQFVTERLLRNPQDFADELRKFYGIDKSEKFKELLTNHLLIGAKLVNDTKKGDKGAADEDRKNWYQNADEIADFLSSINPYWSKSEWKSILYDHLKMTENEATYRLTSQYSADIAQYDEIENQALNMADYMTQGIKKQFNI